MWETQITLPTYLAGEPERNPMFFFGRQSQGAQGPVYPYPMYDTLTGKKVDKSYTILYLENEYLRVGVLPEIGGRLFEAVDKTNNYPFIYRQHVIKPALIGLIGAWISGGIEWNIPHHHRASTFLPVQYRMEEKANGAKTIWVGEMELRDRMRWAVGYTLRPGSSVLETELRIVNRAADANSMLCFANAAVHTNENYQVIFPPSTQFGTHHAKREFTEWPVSHTTYGGADFTKGVDISWYKNHLQPNSVFAWNYEDDFLAGYDHGKRAGTMSVADHRVVPGKKFWTWGNGPGGRRWDRILTDEDGPYIELMVGAYSDNQPDYSWMQPHETRAFSIFWYPFREIGGAKKANTDAAVNLEVEDGRARLGFHVTAAYPNARITLKRNEQVLAERSVSLHPGRPFLDTVELPGGTEAEELEATLSDGEKTLISYRPVRFAKQTQPPVVKAPLPPAAVNTTEELYLIGLRAKQFHSPSVNPLDYWNEALRRDPGDVRVNTALGVLAFTQARYRDAERHLRQAASRVTADYTSPRDPESLYYLGLTLQAQGKLNEAADWLHKTAWSQAWRAPACYSLAQIESTRGNGAEALRLAQQAIDNNALHLRAQNLKAALLRHLGRRLEAASALDAALGADPLDVRAMAEAWLLSRAPEDADRVAAVLNQHPATAQETAAEYAQEGLWQDAADLLQLMVQKAPDKARIHPMPLYYLGWLQGKLGQSTEAARSYEAARRMPIDYVFPFQPEAIAVLHEAMQVNPKDARAAYYLGNLLYDWQPAEAIRLWEQAVTLDPGLALAHRNLAVAYMHLPQGPDTARAIAALERAIAVPEPFALHFAELDAIYESTGAPLERRLQLFRAHPQVVAKRDDAMNRAIAVQIASGQMDEAIETMRTHTFAVAEGVNLNVVEHWTEAHLLRARRRIEAKQIQEALADLRIAAQTPDNLPVDNLRGEHPRAIELAYWTGIALQESGDIRGAKQAFERAVALSSHPAPRRASQHAEREDAGNSQDYFQGLALRQLGRNAEARARFERLARLNAREAPPSSRLVAAERAYVSALGHLGLGDRREAEALLRRALERHPAHVGARFALSANEHFAPR